MAPMELKCLVPTCDKGDGTPYKTEKLEPELAMERMRMHNTAAHPPAAPQANPVRGGRPQEERVKRPILTKLEVDMAMRLMEMHNDEAPSLTVKQAGQESTQLVC